MKIPKTIKIGGHNMRVEIYKDIVKEGTSDSMGTFNSQFNRITIDGRCCQAQQESTLIHEILEAIDFQHELKLPHNTIVTLENSLYQIFSDNNLLK